MELVLIGGGGLGFGGQLQIGILVVDWISVYGSISGYKGAFSGTSFPDFRYGTINVGFGAALYFGAKQLKFVLRITPGISTSFIGPIGFSITTGFGMMYFFTNGLLLGLSADVHLNPIELGGNEGLMVGLYAMGMIGVRF